MKLTPFIESEWKSLYRDSKGILLCFVFVLLFTLPFFFCSVALFSFQILSDQLSAALFVSSSPSLCWSLQAFSLPRFNHFSPSLDLSFRTAPVMVCSTMLLWAEMLLVPHQSTSCPASCRRMCTAAWHNRSAPLGCFWFASFGTLHWTPETLCNQTAFDCN